MNDADQHNTAVTGQEVIASYVLCYKKYEILYLKQGDADLIKAMLQVYLHILEYQAMVAHYFSLDAFERYARNVPRIDDWTGQLSKIEASDKRCQALLRPIAIQDQKDGILKLEQSLEQRLEEILKQIHAQGATSLPVDLDVSCPPESDGGHLAVLYGQFQGRASVIRLPILDIQNDYQLFHRIRIAYAARFHPLYRPGDGCSTRPWTLNWLQWYSIQRVEYVRVSKYV